ncbi:Predicted membrane protein [Lactococcus piscium]|nr:Predicted membrane protein [Lactococcus piscium]
MFLIVVGVGLLLGFLSTRVGSYKAQMILKQIGIAFGVVALIIFVANGYTWIALLFPVILAIIFWKSSGINYTSVKGHNPFEADDNNFERRRIFDNQADNTVSRLSGNDVIDLATTTFQADGNDLTIRKASGNTKIIVPDDVAVVLDVTALSGVVKIFDEITQVNAEHVRYMTPDFGASEKRIRIMIHVGRGSVEVIKG